MLVYSDSEVIDREWLDNLSLPSSVRCRNISEYLAHPSNEKIAFTAHRLHADRDIDLQFERKVKQLSEASLAVFSLESELHHFHWNIWSQCHRDNVYWLLPGTVNDRPDMSSHIIPWQDWLKTTAALYKSLPGSLEKLTPYDVKPRMFDALLGSPKAHRDFVYQSVTAVGLQDRFVMTYGGKWDHKTFYAKDYFIFEPGTELIDPLIGTCDWVRYQGIQCHLSQIMPLDVYNQTAYSIIAETDADNTLSFFSEKTAKPLIARRLFVAFTGYRFLHNLRDLGFQTFGSVIDESYDEIRHGKDRYRAAFEQVIRLCGMDQRSVLEKIRPVLEHNYQHVMTTDWNAYAAARVQQIIDLRLENQIPTVPTSD